MGAAAILGPLCYTVKAHLYTTASKDLTQQLSLLFPAAANWPFASAVVRELLGGSKGADNGSSEGSAKQEFTTQSVFEAEAEGPDEEGVQNFRVLQLLSAAQSQPQGHEVGPRVAPILQHLIPELRSLTPVELAALCKALSDIAWQDSLVDLVLGVVSSPPPFSLHHAHTINLITPSTSMQMWRCHVAAAFLSPLLSAAHSLCTRGYICSYVSNPSQPSKIGDGRSATWRRTM